jgi:glutamate-1-semialdehyde 2,1-aminomutase
VLRDESPYAKLEQLGSQLEAGLSSAAAKAGVEHSVNRVGSMLTLFFNNQRVVDWDTASKSNTQRYSRYFWGLIERGVYMPCSQYEALFISAAHTEADIAATVEAAQLALASSASGEA